jgi:hypothetical protein
MFNLILEYLKSNRDKMPKDLPEVEMSVFHEELRFWGLQQNFSTEQTLHNEDSCDKLMFGN